MVSFYFLKHHRSTLMQWFDSRVNRDSTEHRCAEAVEGFEWDRDTGGGGAERQRDGTRRSGKCNRGSGVWGVCAWPTFDSMYSYMCTIYICVHMSSLCLINIYTLPISHFHYLSLSLRLQGGGCRRMRGKVDRTLQDSAWGDKKEGSSGEDVGWFVEESEHYEKESQRHVAKQIGCSEGSSQHAL